MKHIAISAGGSWNLADYFDYIAANQNNMPAEVYAFASDARNFDLHDRQSLHDSWLEWLLISEPASGSRTETRALQIECRFLGPYHDLYIELQYLDVDRYDLNAVQRVANPHVGHGDLLMHEVRVEGMHVIHEMAFSTGATFAIYCRTFRHKVSPRRST